MLALLQQRLTRRVLFTLAVELVMLNAGIAGILYARGELWQATEHSPIVFLFALVVTSVIQFGLWSFGLYSRQVIYSGSRVFQNLLGAFALLSLLLLPVCYAFSLTGVEVFSVTLKFYLLLLGGFMTLVAIERYVVLKLFNRDTHLGRILILGTDNGVEEVIREARRSHGDSIHFEGILVAAPGEVGRWVADVPVIGEVAAIREIVREHQIRTILVCMPYDSPHLPLDFLLEYKLSGHLVYDAPTFYEGVAQKILIERIEPYSILYPHSYTMTRLKWLAKQGGERLLAFLMLTACSLPLAVAWLLVRMTSPGAAIYTQERVGKGAKTFTLYKFRTMVQDAEARTGPTWAAGSADTRVTTVGRWLRRMRIDELPQLFNVLRGDMAFVGPRPERPEFVEKLTHAIPYYHHRHFVKPGLTGWAQVSYPYGRCEEDAKEKLRYDLYYVKHMSLFFDAVIVLATLQAVVRGEGSSEPKDPNPEPAVAPSTSPQPEPQIS